MPSDVKRKRGRPARYDLETILDAALKILDEDGVEDLTMRRVADAVGMGAMTIYGYVRDRDELLDAVVRRALAKLGGDVDAGRPVERIKAAVRDIHDGLREHPGVLALLASGRVPGPALDHVREHLLAILRDAGMSPERAMVALSVLYSYAIGCAVTEGGASAEGHALEAQRVRDLPPSLYPNLSASSAAYAARHAPATFEAGLDALVRALTTTKGK